jgi:hypothetical protein
MKTHGKRGRPFGRGNPGGPGRPKGSLSKATLAGRELLELLERGDGNGLPSAYERWKRLLTDRDPAVRLKAEVFVFSALHGAPRPAPDSLATEQDIRIELTRGPWSGVAAVRALPAASELDPAETAGE